MEEAGEWTPKLNNMNANCRACTLMRKVGVHVKKTWAPTRQSGECACTRIVGIRPHMTVWGNTVTYTRTMSELLHGHSTSITWVT